MKLPRRRFLHLAAGAIAPSMTSSAAQAQDHPTPPAAGAGERPLADRLAGYAHGCAMKTSSAQELITAIVVAYEVNCRLVDAFDIATRGWDPPVVGLPAVALAVGRL